MLGKIVGHPSIFNFEGDGRAQQQTWTMDDLSIENNEREDVEALISMQYVACTQLHIEEFLEGQLLLDFWRMEGAGGDNVVSWQWEKLTGIGQTTYQNKGKVVLMIKKIKFIKIIF